MADQLHLVESLVEGHRVRRACDFSRTTSGPSPMHGDRTRLPDRLADLLGRRRGAVGGRRPSPGRPRRGVCRPRCTFLRSAARRIWAAIRSSARSRARHLVLGGGLGPHDRALGECGELRRGRLGPAAGGWVPSRPRPRPGSSGGRASPAGTASPRRGSRNLSDTSQCRLLTTMSMSLPDSAPTSWYGDVAGEEKESARPTWSSTPQSPAEAFAAWCHYWPSPPEPAHLTRAGGRTYV